VRGSCALTQDSMSLLGHIFDLHARHGAIMALGAPIRKRAVIGMSACCSLDELGKPSFVEHRSCLPPGQIARASSGPTPATRLTTTQARTSQAGRSDPAAPRSSSSGGCLPPHGAPRGPDRCSPGRRARLPHQGPCTGGSRLWFPILRLAFQKRPSSCGDFRGRRWVRTTGFSLVRRNRVRIKPSPKAADHAFELRKPCREMP
jgi:hypothetical protein